MLRETRVGHLLLTPGQLYEDSPMNWNESAWIIVSEIDKNHAHPQFTQKFLVKGLQAAVPVKANQQRVKVEIEPDSSHPIQALNRLLVPFQCVPHLRQQIGP